jgi:dihydroxyacetone kinase
MAGGGVSLSGESGRDGGGTVLLWRLTKAGGLARTWGEPHFFKTNLSVSMSNNPAKKIINDPLKCADELFDGLVLAYDGKARKVGERSIVMNNLRPDAPALLVGGGAGHEPIYHGLVGKGMADGAAIGDIFAAPPPNIVLEATQAVSRGKGVLFLYGNYAGDVMNFDIGAELAADEGIEVRTVIIADDVCSAPPTEKGKRRGVAGLVPITKLAGAAAMTVSTLDDLERIAQKAVDNTRTVGVSTKPGSIPATGQPTFDPAVRVAHLDHRVEDGVPGLRRFEHAFGNMQPSQQMCWMPRAWRRL